LVGLLFLVQRLLQKPGRILHSKLFRPCPQSAVAGDLVMLDRLCGRENAGIHDIWILGFLHDLLGFFDEALHGFARFATGPASKLLEDLLQALHLTDGLFPVRLHRLAELLVFGGLGHLRHRSKELLLGVVDVFQQVKEKFFQLLHDIRSVRCVRAATRQHATQRSCTETVPPSRLLDPTLDSPRNQAAKLAVVASAFGENTMLELLADPQAWAALVTLTVLEVVLGIDNVIFISILVSRLEEKSAARARQIGLGLALAFRLVLLFALTWIMALSEPVIEFFGRGFSWRDIILIAGGLFLIGKATHEIHGSIEGEDDDTPAGAAGATFSMVIFQVIIIDLVFSIDSIITAIGMAQDLPIMITAVIIAVAVMYVASGPVSAFISRHPTTKMLALAFLVLIGVALVADGFGAHIPRGYVYSAMVFAGLVEMFNVLAQRRRLRKKHSVAGTTHS